jgi:hypothetical protein
LIHVCEREFSKYLFLLEFATGSEADEERNRRAEDGIGEGALEEQENQAVRLDGGRS